MTGNGNFTTPYPPLAEVTAALDELDAAAQAAENGGTELTAIKDAKEDVADGLLSQLAAYVQSHANYSETVIRSAGIDVRNAPSPVGIPAQVLGLNALFSLLSQTIRLKWKRVRGAYIYRLLMTADINAPDSWQEIALVSSTRYMATGLTTGTRYWFKAEAVGSAGTGAASDPATMIAA